MDNVFNTLDQSASNGSRGFGVGVIPSSSLPSPLSWLSLVKFFPLGDLLPPSLSIFGNKKRNSSAGEKRPFCQRAYWPLIGDLGRKWVGIARKYKDGFAMEINKTGQRYHA
jgi:hypothetical protein